MPLTLDTLNAATPAEAAALLDGLYEHSPWVVEAAMAQRPFRSLAHLKHACAQAVTEGGLDRQLALMGFEWEKAAGTLPLGAIVCQGGRHITFFDGWLPGGIGRQYRYTFTGARNEQ